MLLSALTMMLVVREFGDKEGEQHLMKDGESEEILVDKYAALPDNVDKPVDVSFLMQYWGGGKRTADHAKVGLLAMKRMRTCAAKVGLTCEILVCNRTL